MNAVEKEIATVCDQVLERSGWDIERYEQARATQIENGLPDRRVVHRRRELRLWIEYKRPGRLGQMTREQHAWLLAEIAGGGWAVVIDDQAQLLHLLDLIAGGRPGRHEVVRNYCLELIALAALKGYRKEKKSDGPGVYLRKPRRLRGRSA